jgi:hypothetical protein
MQSSLSVVIGEKNTNQANMFANPYIFLILGGGDSKIHRFLHAICDRRVPPARVTGQHVHAL